MQATKKERASQCKTRASKRRRATHTTIANARQERVPCSKHTCKQASHQTLASISNMHDNREPCGKLQLMKTQTRYERQATQKTDDVHVDYHALTTCGDRRSFFQSALARSGSLSGTQPGNTPQLFVPIGRGSCLCGCKWHAPWVPINRIVGAWLL